MDQLKGPSVALLIHRRQRSIESCRHSLDCRGSNRSPNPSRQDPYDPFNGIPEQVDQANTHAGVLQKIDGYPEIVSVFLFHSIERGAGLARLLKKANMTQTVMPNSFRHLMNSTYRETLKS
jgi:hypothetical protein